MEALWSGNYISFCAGALLLRQLRIQTLSGLPCCSLTFPDSKTLDDRNKHRISASKDGLCLSHEVHAPGVAYKGKPAVSGSEGGVCVCVCVCVW